MLLCFAVFSFSDFFQQLTYFLGLHFVVLVELDVDIDVWQIADCFDWLVLDSDVLRLFSDFGLGFVLGAVWAVLLLIWAFIYISGCLLDGAASGCFLPWFLALLLSLTRQVDVALQNIVQEHHRSIWQLFLFAFAFLAAEIACVWVYLDHAVDHRLSSVMREIRRNTVCPFYLRSLVQNVPRMAATLSVFNVYVDYGVSESVCWISPYSAF